MLNYHSFVRNEHTCLLSDDAIRTSAFAYHLNLGLVIWDFGLFDVKVFSFLTGNSVGQSAVLLSRKSRVRAPPCQPKSITNFKLRITC